MKTNTRAARIAAITTDEMTTAIEDLVDGMTSADILAVPGVYELLSEYLNNEAIDHILDSEDLDEDDTCPEHGAGTCPEDCTSKEQS